MVCSILDILTIDILEILDNEIRILNDKILRACILEKSITTPLNNCLEYRI